MVPETRAELPQAQSPGPAAQQDTSRASHSHPWGQGCPSHRQLPVLSEPCTASAQPQRQLSAVGEDPGAARIIPRSSSAALRQLPGQGSRRGASRHARLWSSSPCVRPQGPGFCPAARSSPRCPPCPTPHTAGWHLPDTASLWDARRGAATVLRAGPREDLRGSPSAQPDCHTAA